MKRLMGMEDAEEVYQGRSRRSIISAYNCITKLKIIQQNGKIHIYLGIRTFLLNPSLEK